LINKKMRIMKIRFEIEMTTKCHHNVITIMICISHHHRFQQIINHKIILESVKIHRKMSCIFVDESDTKPRNGIGSVSSINLRRITIRDRMEMLSLQSISFREQSIRIPQY
jgi:hypothetical protein